MNHGSVVAENKTILLNPTDILSTHRAYITRAIVPESWIICRTRAQNVRPYRQGRQARLNVNLIGLLMEAP